MLTQSNEQLKTLTANLKADCHEKTDIIESLTQQVKTLSLQNQSLRDKLENQTEVLTTEKVEMARRHTRTIDTAQLRLAFLETENCRLQEALSALEEEAVFCKNENAKMRAEIVGLKKHSEELEVQIANFKMGGGKSKIFPDTSIDYLDLDSSINNPHRLPSFPSIKRSHRFTNTKFAQAVIKLSRSRSSSEDRDHKLVHRFFESNLKQKMHSICSKEAQFPSGFPQKLTFKSAAYLFKAKTKVLVFVVCSHESLTIFRCSDRQQTISSVSIKDIGRIKRSIDYPQLNELVYHDGAGNYASLLLEVYPPDSLIDFLLGNFDFLRPQFTQSKFRIESKAACLNTLLGLLPDSSESAFFDLRSDESWSRWTTVLLVCSQNSLFLLETPINFDFADYKKYLRCVRNYRLKNFDIEENTEHCSTERPVIIISLTDEDERLFIRALSSADHERWLLLLNQISDTES